MWIVMHRNYEKARHNPVLACSDHEDAIAKCNELNNRFQIPPWDVDRDEAMGGPPDERFELAECEHVPGPLEGVVWNM